MELTKHHLLVVLFNFLYIIPFAIYYTYIENYEFLLYIGVLVLIAVFVAATLRTTKLDFLSLWLLSFWGLLHMLGGGLVINGATLYRLRIIELINNGGDFYILKMDQVIHFYGFAVAAFALYHIVAQHFKDRNSKIPLFLAWTGSMGLGALNEVIEFIAFVFIMQTGVGDIYNIGLDLIFNMCGALLGAYIARRLRNARIK